MTSGPIRRPQTSPTVAELSADFPALGLIARTTEPAPEWLDGPKFVAWLDQYLACRDVWLSEATKRRMREWRSGAAASLGAADRLLIDIGAHLHDLPDDLWTNPPTRPRGRMPTDRERYAAIARVKAGEDPAEVGADYGVTRHAVCRWLRELNPQDAESAPARDSTGL